MPSKLVPTAFQADQPLAVPTNPACLKRIAAVLARDAAAMNTRAPESWKGMSEKGLWNVLASCILGSQVSNSQLQACMVNLEVDGLAEPWLFKSGISGLAKLFRTSLSPRTSIGKQAKRPGYRFPQRGARLLAEAVKAVYGDGGSIRTLIENAGDTSRLRRSLVASIPGIGPKQASLFLLEIGVSDDFASLDRHLLRYLALTGTIPTVGGFSTHTPSGLDAYEHLESALRVEAGNIGVSLAALDTAIWALMRAWSTYAEIFRRSVNLSVA